MPKEVPITKEVIEEEVEPPAEVFTLFFKFFLAKRKVQGVIEICISKQLVTLYKLTTKMLLDYLSVYLNMCINCYKK